MANTVSQASVVRGADGRLYAVTTHSVSEVSEAGTAAFPSNIRANSRSGFDTADYEAGRYVITPGI